MFARRVKSGQWRRGLQGGLLAGFLGWLVLFSPLGDPMANWSYDLGFIFRPSSVASNVCIVYMDLKSHIELSQDSTTGWDRDLHAKLVNRLRECQARVVAFDVAFLPGTNDAAADQLLADAARNHGRVVVGALVEERRHDGRLVGQGLTQTYEALEAVTVTAVVEEGDARIIRKHFFVEGYDDPGLAYRVAELHLGKAPPNPYQARWLNPEPPESIANFSYCDVVAEENPIACGAFSNKVVFVGGRYPVGFPGGPGGDYVKTPYTLWMRRLTPGVDLNASAYLNWVRGDWLYRTPPFLELALVFLWGGLIAFGVCFVRPVPALVMGLVSAAVVATLAMSLMWRTHLWFPWMVVAGVQVPAAVLWSLLTELNRLRQNQGQLEREVALAELAAQSSPFPGGQPSSPASDSGSAPAAFPAFPGQPRIPDYELLRKIGEGAYGEVWLARDLVGCFRAIKIVYRRQFTSAEPFDREFKGIKNYAPVSLSHPGLVPILHVGRHEHPKAFYCIMELGDDETAGETIDPANYSPRNLAKDVKTRKKMPWSECVDIFLQLAEALDFLHHRNLVHRDIKPSNVIFVRGSPKIADIGLVTEAAGADGDVSYVGTQHYIAPEGPGTPAADVFSLGKLMYVAAFGLDPAQFPNLPTALMDETGNPAGYQLNEIVLKACEPEVAQRYQTVAALREDLLRVRQSLAGPG